MTKRIDRTLLAQQVGPLLGLLAELEPALETETVLAAIREAAVLPAGQRRIAQEVVDRPDLLTGQAAAATLPGVLRLVDALVRAGATTVVAPLCPRCGKRRPLGRSFDGLRLCDGCTRKAVAMPCGRCGKLRPPARRNDNGHPICQACWWRDPRSWKPCTSCGDQRRVAAITDAGPVCTRCRQRPELICGICGRTGRCTISRATGQPMCDRCRERWAVCSRCGTGASAKGGTLDAPLCARCVNPDPAFWTRCGTCGITWQLTTSECSRCRLDRKLAQIFTTDGTATPQLDQLRTTFVQVDRPDHALDWLNNPGVRDTLRAVALVRPTLTHEALDAMPTSGTLTHIRSMLAAAGALPPRDERLAALEPWIRKTIGERTTIQDQRVLHAYAVWHHLRRLRRRLGDQIASHQQAKNIRDQVAGAAAFLDWLHTRGSTLAACTQTDLDQWLASKTARVTRSASFVRWAATHHHAPRLTAPATRWTGPAGPLDQDRRWADTRRLLHDDAYPTADRIAGLLVLLYAQKLNVISTLTTQHLRHADGQTLLILGSRPVVLPAPLDRLVNELADATRQPPGSSLINTPSDWLFPGRWPGRPLTDDGLARRLRAHGLQPRQGLNTALFMLAAEVPAAILAKMLGIHIKAAIQWQQLSNWDWTTYAAEVSQRTPGNSNSSNS